MIFSARSTWREKSTQIDSSREKHLVLLSSPISSTNVPSQLAPTHVIDGQQSSGVVAAISSCPLSTTSSASTLKAFVCTCLKSNHAHEQNCSASNVIKPSINPSLTSPTIVCRPPPSHRSLAQRAAVASQIRSNRTISMTPMKEQGQTSTVLPAAISNGRLADLSPTHATPILSHAHPLPK